MSQNLCLLTIHAHPDDEASKGAGTVAKYADEGIKTVLVCCTGGEEGEILNPEMKTPENQSNLKEIRQAELEKSVEIIGYHVLEHLGYRDSGMEGSDANGHSNAFAKLPLEEPVEKLVKIIRQEKPSVIITYSDEQGGYRHPDHVRVHDISRPAFDMAGDPDAFPEAGEPFQPSKLYYTVWSRTRIEAMHKKFLELDLKSPYEEWWFKRPSNEDKITTRVEVEKWYDRRCDALLAHKTQVDPASSFWFGLPREVAAKAYPYDDYILAHSLFETELPEEDIFAGLR